MHGRQLEENDDIYSPLLLVASTAVTTRVLVVKVLPKRQNLTNTWQNLVP